MSEPLHVRWIGPFAKRTGYGQATHDYLLALHLAGVSLDIQPLHDADSEDLDPRYGALLDLVGPKKPPTHIVVHTIPRYANEFVTGDLAPTSGIRKVCVTTWETNRFPKEDAKRLDQAFDLVIVPSEFCRRSMIQAGLPTTKVWGIPHTFDPRFWILPKDHYEDQAARSPYIFYSILSWTDRKNPIGLLKAYLSEFRASDDVHLRIVSPVVNEDDITTLVRCMGLDDLPSVEFLGRHDQKGRLSETDLRHIHYDSDCYVSASRGEGWGLGAFEAACVGNPVIVPGFSGWTDYLDDYSNKEYIGGFPTPAVTPEVKIGKGLDIGGIHITSMASGAPTGIAGDQDWWEPNLADLKSAMRAAYKRRQAKSSVDQGRFVERFGYSTIGGKWWPVLENLQ